MWRSRPAQVDVTTPRRPTRLLLVTNMYPTPDRPQSGPFVARRVASLRARGVEVVVAGPSTYRRGAALRHLQIAWRAFTARGPFDGVEAHPVYAAGVIGLLAARLRRRPMVAFAHGSDVSVQAQRGRVARSLATWVVRGAGIVVANSADTASAVSRLGPHRQPRRGPEAVQPGRHPEARAAPRTGSTRGFDGPVRRTPVRL